MMLKMRKVVHVDEASGICADASGRVVLMRKKQGDTAYGAACNTAGAEGMYHRCASFV
jgi:hypothetical protein